MVKAKDVGDYKETESSGLHRVIDIPIHRDYDSLHKTSCKPKPDTIPAWKREAGTKSHPQLRSSWHLTAGGRRKDGFL